MLGNTTGGLAGRSCLNSSRQQGHAALRGGQRDDERGDTGSGVREVDGGEAANVCGSPASGLELSTFAISELFTSARANAARWERNRVGPMPVKSHSTDTRQA